MLYPTPGSHASLHLSRRDRLTRALAALGVASLALCLPHPFALAGEAERAAPSTPNPGAQPQGQAPEGWTTESPRAEVAPAFAYNPKGGPDGQGSFVIEADEREGLIGWWRKTIPVRGGRTYQFTVKRKASGSENPRLMAVPRLTWQNAKGNSVRREKPTEGSYNRKGGPPIALPEFPPDLGQDEQGWTTVSATYHVPAQAAQALVELSYQWQASGRVEWAGVSLEEVSPLPPRKAKLATVHLIPANGTTNQEMCEQFAKPIEEAARQGADLVVLPECLTHMRRKATRAECAEPIPGPSTDYFGKLAKQHDLYIVAGLLEREKHLIYNVAVLIGPDGGVVGKYRKVTLPRGEVTGGVTPGHEYPVFQTRFGRVGMMICYDGFFPEVARALSNRGAEVIAWPVAGCNPLLAQARACENHVYLVSSTYTDPSADWTRSAIYAHDGRPLAQAEKWGTIAIAEVDLNEPIHWHSLGEFKAQLLRHRPPAPSEPESH